MVRAGVGGAAGDVMGVRVGRTVGDGVTVGRGVSTCGGVGVASDFVLDAMPTIARISMSSARVPTTIRRILFMLKSIPLQNIYTVGI